MAFVGFLRQSTATTLNLGPFVDSVDAVTSETGLTIARADVLLWKQGDTTATQKTEATSATHRQNGDYTCPVDTTDTGTVGMLTVRVTKAGALQLRQDYCVLPQSTYDIFFANGLTTLFTTQLTESYSADGAAPTVAQALCLLLARLFETNVSGTAITLKKFDGTTTAAVLTANDATNPSAVTRTT
jgi:hypothetical protein